jgi:hypothetical protein
VRVIQHEPSQNGLSALVEDVTYLGPQRHLRLRSDRLGVVLATLVGPSPTLRVGEVVTLDWSPESAWIVPGPESLPPGDADRSR